MVPPMSSIEIGVVLTVIIMAALSALVAKPETRTPSALNGTEVSRLPRCFAALKTSTAKRVQGLVISGLRFRVPRPWRMRVATAILSTGSTGVDCLKL